MPQASHPRILIVDDDPSALRSLANQLTDAGYEVLTANSGGEAMGIIQAEGTPIVIADWVMPGMDGLELCRAIRAHEGIPFAFVIIVSDREGGEDHLVEAFDAGADDYLRKPYKFKELLARLRAGERIVKLHEELDSRNRQVHRYNAEVEVANAKLAAANEELNRMATTDELTGLINRREALVRLADYWVSAQRHGSPLACIAVDIDHFKRCNDAYGHAVGDVVLKETARVLRESARRDEPVCRVGGEEFLILCPVSTEALAAIGAERLRRAVEANVIRAGRFTLSVTISLGVAERTPDMQRPDDLLRRADDALYAAKDAGRNTVCLAGTHLGELSADPSGGELCATLAGTPKKNERSEKPASVLVIAADPVMRTSCRNSLEREGYEVLESGDGADALCKAERKPPDVIVMDPDPPRIDGLECARRFKANPQTQGIPIIITGARAEDSSIMAGLQVGADEYLAKPFQPQELVLRVKTMVRLRRELGRSNEVRGEQSRALGLLLDFSRDIAAASSLDDVLERTVNVAAALTCCRRVSIMLPDADHRTLSIAKSLGIEPYREAGVRVPIGADTCGYVFQSREAVVLRTLSQIRRCGNDPDALVLSSVPSVSTPLCAPECAVGVLTLTGRQDGRPFTPVELEYLDLICNIAASSIHERLTCRARDEARHSIVIALAKLAEHRDTETGKHLDRVTRFCCLLAQELRSVERYRTIITEEFLADLERAVPLHDIGKVAIPDHILLKPGPLNAMEIAVMQTHAEIGARTIRSVIERVPGTRFLATAEAIAYAHHERYDGGGYPRGLRGDNIPLAARITAIADVYDAITTKRVYKRTMSHQEAVTIITQASGRQFDPDVVEAFIRCEPQFERLAAELTDDLSVVSTAARADIVFEQEPIFTE